MINVTDEISTLKKVLVKRPGKEINILNKNNMDAFLIDDVIDLKQAQKEHDLFVDILKKENVDVYYLEDLISEVLNDENIKEAFLKEYLENQNCSQYKIYEALWAIKDTKAFVEATMSGFDGKLTPMPNLYFTRDPFTIIGNHIALYNMHTEVRNREVIYGKYINKYHPLFKLDNLYTNNKYQIEGGDVMLLDKETLIIGNSERTSLNAALALTKEILAKTNIKQALFIEIPSKRACMHLDTVFTRFNKDSFIIFDEIYQSLKLSLYDQNGLTKIDDNLKTTLKKLLKHDIKIISCGNKDNQLLEQWNEACNTLCIAPNKFIVYDINKTTNEKFKKQGATIYELHSKELIKGRGGPHCMSMPLLRI